MRIWKPWIFLLLLFSIFSLSLNLICLCSNTTPCRVGLVVSVSASHTVGRGFASRYKLPSIIARMLVCLFVCLCLTSHRQRGHSETVPPFTVPCERREATHALDSEFNSAARLSKRPGSVWNCICTQNISWDQSQE